MELFYILLGTLALIIIALSFGNGDDEEEDK
jgi:hypothetical protein